MNRRSGNGGGVRSRSRALDKSDADSLILQEARDRVLRQLGDYLTEQPGSKGPTNPFASFEPKSAAEGKTQPPGRPDSRTRRMPFAPTKPSSSPGAAGGPRNPFGP